MPLDDGQLALLEVYATKAGWVAITAAFDDAVIEAVVTSNQGNLMLAAADLLDGLPASVAGGEVSKFKLDVLEFTFNKTDTLSWAGLAASLRLRAKSASVTSRINANPAPEFEEWGIR